MRLASFLINHLLFVPTHAHSHTEERNPCTIAVVEKHIPGYLHRAAELKQFLVENPELIERNSRCASTIVVPIDVGYLDMALAEIVGLDAVKQELLDLDSKFHFDEVRASRGIHVRAVHAFSREHWHGQDNDCNPARPISEGSLCAGRWTCGDDYT